MVFSSLIFLWLFLPVVLCLYYIAKDSYRNLLLLIASLFFYAWGEPIYVLVMIFSIVINYVCGQLIGGESAKNK
ncbi:MAG: MBOAT family protein, partial [Alphaproteobacteria bacterium]|nr:MBOAT family protein [Alphaproteobacteria bacterium]